MTRRIWLDPTPAGRRYGARRIDIEPGRYFTTVTLDRDDYAYRLDSQGHTAEAELSAEFTEAVLRFLNCACDHLWVNGYPGGFSYGLGPGTVTLFVPYALADQAAEALRAAEIDGDVHELDVLAEALKVPLDDWLAPGERELRRGVDFAATPSAFLQFLRGKARARGLRLNGRAVPGAIWVRPQMPPLRRELRSRYPADYADYADPTLYVDHRDSDSVPLRPYVGARAQTTNSECTPVVFVESHARSRKNDRCPCGSARALETDDSRHVQRHMRWATGVPVPRTLTWHGENIAVVTATSPVRWRELAHKCALLPKRENGYDFASFSVGDGTPSEDNLRAYLYRLEGRVVGFVSAIDTDVAQWRSFEPPKVRPQPTDGRLRPVVNVIFTAHVWRRQGIAKELVEAIAADAELPVSEIAWNTPLSTAGSALARSTATDGAWLT